MDHDKTLFINNYIHTKNLNLIVQTQTMHMIFTSFDTLSDYLMQNYADTLLNNTFQNTSLDVTNLSSLSVDIKSYKSALTNIQNILTKIINNVSDIIQDFQNQYDITDFIEYLTKILRHKKIKNIIDIVKCEEYDFSISLQIK